MNLRNLRRIEYKVEREDGCIASEWSPGGTSAGGALAGSDGAGALSWRAAQDWRDDLVRRELSRRMGGAAWLYGGKPASLAPAAP